MDVSIVVNHYKSTSTLELSLGYLRNWEYYYEKINGKNKTEIIVTDSETTQETLEMMNHQFADIKFIKNEKNIGFGKSVNAGLKIAKGKYIFIMNADCMVPYPEELNKLLDYLKSTRSVGVIGPKLLNFDNTHQHSAFRFYTPFTILARRTPLGKTAKGEKAIKRFIMAKNAIKSHEGINVDWLMGSALLTKKEYLDKIGFFDERFFMYMEDVDLCRRFWEAGFKVMYCPISKIYHFHGKASHKKGLFLFNRYTIIHTISACKYFIKHGTKTPSYATKF